MEDNPYDYHRFFDHCMEDANEAGNDTNEIARQSVTSRTEKKQESPQTCESLSGNINLSRPFNIAATVCAIRE